MENSSFPAIKITSSSPPEDSSQKSSLEKNEKENDIGADSSNEQLNTKKDLYSGKYQSSLDKAPSLLAWLLDKI